MGDVDTGLFLDRIPYIKAGSGSGRAVIFFGGNALFKRLDRSDANRHAAMFSRLLPADSSFYILDTRKTHRRPTASILLSTTWTGS
jgi:hypothetical protein